MKSLIPVGISGTGHYVPERVLSNFDLEKMVDTSDEWIVQRTGIRERRIAAANEASGDMGTQAARRCLENARVRAEDVELILCATTTPDQPFPATACHIAHNIGAVNAGGFDINSACSGFVFALNSAIQFVASGTYRNVLVVGCEKLSTILNWQDRTTCILFGDGAGAAMVQPLAIAGRGEVLSTSMKVQGGNDEVLQVAAGGSRIPPTKDSVASNLHFMQMGGNKIFKFAVRTLAELVETSCQPYGYEQLGIIIPHQVNLRIMEAAMERLQLEQRLAFSNIHKYGNTAAASVPIALDEAIQAGACIPGKLVCMVAFGGGLSWGHTLLRW